MTSNLTKIVLAIVAVLSIAAVVIAVRANPQVSASLGAAGGMLAENYLPYVMYNDGYKSEKNIELSGASGDITTGDDLTVTDDVTVNGRSVVVTTSNTSTSTVAFGCWESTSTSTATVVKVRLVASSTAPTNGSGIIAEVSYGACP